MKKIILVVGARPNFMKAYPIYKVLSKKFKLILIHTGQHYDNKMSKIFFDEFNFPKPDIQLQLESESKAGEIERELYIDNKNINIDSIIDKLLNNRYLGQISEIRDKLKEEFLKINPDLVIVFGDITSTLSASLAAKLLNIKIGHIEAGLRSNDMEMPEEINRILVDKLSDYYFITEDSGVNNLINENIKNNLFLVGNTMIDCLSLFLEKIEKLEVYKKYNLERNNYFLITLHRPSNVDNYENLNNIFEQISKLSNKIIFPIHPRTKNNLKNINNLSDNIILIEPLGYFEFISLLIDCKVIITDSGGIQEEATYLNKQCFTLRKNTERPQTLISNGGTNMLINDIENLEIIKFQNIKINYWDGKTSERILNILEKIL